LYAAFRSGIYAPLLGSDAVSILILLTTLSILHFGGPDLAVVLLFAVLILSVVVNTGKVAGIANRKPLIWLGDISYSLYLLHGFFHFAIAQLLIAFGVQKGADLSIRTSSYLLMAMVQRVLFRQPWHTTALRSCGGAT
jgi:peptidoglycan/LPS O-acetylase OafA/YrhL